MEELFDEGEIFQMRMDFLWRDAAVEELAYQLYIFCNFAGEVLPVFAFLVLAPCELDDGSIIEIANFFKACIEDIPSDVAIDLG